MKMDVSDRAGQLAVLYRNLADSEASWKATGFGTIANPIAASLRRDIAMLESQPESSQAEQAETTV